MENAHDLSFQREAANWEVICVKAILREFGLTACIPRLLDEYWGLEGEKRLTIGAFDRVFPGFPICLEAMPFYRLDSYSTCSQTALFRNYRRYLPYRWFKRVLENTAHRAEGRPVGLVYRWPGVQNGVILHNGDFPTRDFQQKLPWGKGHVTVQHFRRFVRTLAAGDWTMQTLTSPQPAKSAESTWKEPSPWELARLVPDWAELRLVALLLEILFHIPPEERGQYVVRRDGERWVSVTQQWLAENLPSSVKTVERAVEGLADRGLIEVRRGPNGNNEIRLCLEALQ